MDLDIETIKLIQEEFQNDFSLPGKENIPDAILARQLQEQFEKELRTTNSSSNVSPDSLLARSLQKQFEHDRTHNTSYGDLVYDKKNKQKDKTKSLVDPSWEVIDPTPDIHVLFIAFNSKFFWGKLDSVSVAWSKRMKRCAGICYYHRGGLCNITLSEPLLKLRPRKDLIETLLHEMIHAFLFVTHNNKDRDGHGPEFHKHMYRINKEAGTNITVYHTFHDEVELYLQHWWRCDGPCQKRQPFFGIVRRSSNRAPGPNDRWWGEHSRSCGGTFIKIRSPEPTNKGTQKTKTTKPSNGIKKFISNSGALEGTSKSNIIASTSNTKAKPISSNIHNVSKPGSGLSTSVTIPSKTNNIHGFSNSATKNFVKGGTKINSNTIVVTKKPTTNSQENKIGTPIKSGTSQKSQNTDNARSGSNENLIDYSIVRNHWINKFSNSQPNKTQETSSINKRKSSEPIPVPAKTTKLEDFTSQDSLDCESASCPVCNVSYPIEELNRHLDMCLSEPKNNFKECIVCAKDINIDEYQEHVNLCLEQTFGDNNTPKQIKDTYQNKDGVIVIDEDSLDIDYVKCSICKNQIVMEDFQEHLKLCQNRTKCPECGKKVDSSSYDIHLADCLMKAFDKIDSNLTSFKKSSDKVNNDDVEDTITCLVCGKYILKNNLYSHLDECVKEIYDKDEKEETTEDKDDEDDKLYNCPFCLTLTAEVDMSDHIDVCLETYGDAEAEENKSLFLSEID